jgi:hypothetical protein
MVFTASLGLGHFPTGVVPVVTDSFECQRPVCGNHSLLLPIVSRMNALAY